MVEKNHLVLDLSGVTLKDVQRYGRRLGRALRPGDLVVLEGPLGSGKTTLVRAVAEALDVTDPVRSPSFTLANIYSGRWTVQHLDLYRLEQLEDDDALALEEYSGDEAVTLVEWPAAGQGTLGEPGWRVIMEHESLRTRSVQVWAYGKERLQRWEGAGSGG